MKIIWLSLLVVLSSLLISCATEEFYSAPPNLTNYAIIDDDAHSKYLIEDGSHVKKTVRIISVDRVTVSYKRNFIPPHMAINLTDTKGIVLRKAIPLSPGEHKLLIEVCEGPIENPWEIMILPTSVKRCARTVFRLTAEPNGRYQLAGSVSKAKNHADIWVENLRDGTLSVDKIRIKGLSP